MRFNKLIPELSVIDVSKSLNFYTQILGFKIEYQRKESEFIFLSYQGSQIMIEKTNEKWKTGKLEYPFGRGINFQIEVDALEPLLESLKRHDYPLKIEPQDHWYRKGKALFGNKEFLVMDPDGYLLRFFEDLGSKEL